MLTKKLITDAHEFARLAHDGQKRRSGEDYIIHPEAVANILAAWKMDSVSIAAGYLHDTVEDGSATEADIEKHFGQTVALLVKGVSKVGQLKLRESREEEFIENLRKMFLAMAQDLRVVVIKLADRLHNMQTLHYLPAAKQQRIAWETLEVYAPLAERLGMGEIKGQLEDLAFPYIFPEDAQWLEEKTASVYNHAEVHVEEAKKEILAALIKEDIKGEIHGRAKHRYSLYRKLLRPEVDRDLTKIHDLVALRVILNTVEECYVALGVIHSLYRPVPALGVSDFIAVPKPNGYRSIHTKVFGPAGRIIEIQIRTTQMHEEAEYGVAAHFRYAELKNKGVDVSEGKAFAPRELLSWVKQLANWQQEVIDNQEFMHDLRVDALQHRIFVFTPNSDIKDLPTGATPIDFAYAVHTALGDRTVGAKINGKMVAFDTKLKSGDVCEIILSKEPRKPNHDWLDFVTTRLAKREIEKGLKAKA